MKESEDNVTWGKAEQGRPRSERDTELETKRLTTNSEEERIEARSDGDVRMENMPRIS